ncbi:hypothetical protein [Sinorhizobium meliloti]|uniref:hypothetical protein n=1 Tax=Rhizobium meliloti TaxID=382 RepID=UPI000FD5D7D6|nr:hypothetical protein [Sinorhizobium meliloti]RVJ69802.1 hypothetical protein CN171_22600 [Sinorhizobium meliloti]
MWNAIKEFARQHLLLTVGMSMVTGLGTGGLATYFSLYEAKVNRVAELQVEDYKAIIADKRKFEEALSTFTLQLGTNGKVNAEKQQELAAALRSLYSNLDGFTYLQGPPADAVKRLKTSINDLRKQVQLTNDQKDLDPLGLALKSYFRNLKNVQAVMDEAVGKVEPAMES